MLQVRDRAWFVRLYGEIIPSFSEGIIDHIGAQTLLYLTCTTITSVDLAHHGMSRAKNWVSMNCGTMSDFPSQFIIKLIGIFIQPKQYVTLALCNIGPVA